MAIPRNLAALAAVQIYEHAVRKATGEGFQELRRKALGVTPASIPSEDEALLATETS